MEKLLMLRHSKNLLLIVSIVYLIPLTGCVNKESNSAEDAQWIGATAIPDTIKNNLSKGINQHSRYYRNIMDKNLNNVENNYKFHQTYSYSFKKTGEHYKAMKLLNEAVQKNPIEVLGYRAWCMLYYYRDYEKAINDIDTLMSLTGNCMEVSWGESCLYNKALAYYKLDEFDKAIQTLNEWRDCEENYGLSMKDNEYYHFYLARSYHKNNNIKEAINSYQKAITASGSSYTSEYNYYLALGLYEEGKSKQACELMRNVKVQVDKGNKFNDMYIELFDELYSWMPSDKLKEWNCPNIIKK